jgi:hypothetical protein
MERMHTSTSAADRAKRAISVLVESQWHSRKFDPARSIQDIQDKARVCEQTCARGRDETVDGDRATLYAVHTRRRPAHPTRRRGSRQRAACRFARSST